MLAAFVATHYEGRGAVRAALGRGNPELSGLVPAVTAPDSLTIRSGSLRRMSRRPGAKGRRDRLSSVFQLPDYGVRACLRGRTADTSSIHGEGSLARSGATRAAEPSSESVLPTRHDLRPTVSPAAVGIGPQEKAVTERDRADLKARTIEAHREFLLALIELERREYEWGRVLAGYAIEECHNASPAACVEAEVYKDRCYSTFMELAGRLGFFPAGHGIKLPRQPYIRQRRL